MGYKRYSPLVIEIEGKEVEMFNSYGCYSAAYVHLSGKPYKKEERKPNWFSATQCKKMKLPVTETEEPIAFARSHNGYYALYQRD